ncbi:hypothetical protein G3I15_48735 [Streptomyces sp. SID10244]|nr:hypothetical protein [Streptomyces sp. SID10244]
MKHAIDCEDERVSSLSIDMKEISELAHETPSRFVEMHTKRRRAMSF